MAFCPLISASTTLQCRFQQARYQSGQREAALSATAELWAAGHSQPKACDDIFAVLKRSEHFDAALKWRRFEAALSNNKTRLARYVRSLMDMDDVARADHWLKLHRDPQDNLPSLVSAPQQADAADMFVHATRRALARPSVGPSRRAASCT